VQDEASRRFDVDENTFRFNPRMAYQINQDFGVEAAYMYEQVDDQVNDNLSERNVVWCRLFYQYPLFE
jgi:long-subunit fatty acid transport protein